MPRETNRETPPPAQSDSDTRALLENRLHDPRRVLGPHAAGAGQLIVRALLPHAREACLGRSRLPMTESTAGLYEWRGDASAIERPYEIAWRDGEGVEHSRFDPYAFGVQLDTAALQAFAAGRSSRADRLLGAHCVRIEGVDGVRFGVWAPNAERVSVIGDFNRWDGRCHPLSAREATGVWELFIPGLRPGELYKYEIRNRQDGSLYLKSDPYGAAFEHRPATASRIARTRYVWQDGDWLRRRRERDWLSEPMSIYEVHLGSWRRGPDGRLLTYEEAGDALGAYVRDLGFTHVELLPVTEHPFDDSWGYQCTGYFAPTRRHGEPDGLRGLVDSLHSLGIGVLLDWVPGHFPKDSHALARFDGTPLYEYADPHRGEHPDWGTLVFDYSRREVQSFLLSSARFWLDEFHFDGLRVDAVASMLYLDYSRGPGQWQPNAHGGNENTDAVELLRRLNVLTHGECTGTITVAEESTAWPQVSRPTDAGGLGFSFKWNMGWMHDTLEYMKRDPVHRRFHHHLLSFGPVYAFTENFVLPLSHDEVVHGKRSLWDKMPGDEWQKTANLRLLLAYQWTYPGKKLLFMGAELAQRDEWNHRTALPWHLADSSAARGMAALIRDLNALYRNAPALHAREHDPSGFAWLAWDDADNSILSYLRRSDHEHLVVVLNFTPVPRHGYRVGVPGTGRYRVVLNSDSAYYGGSNVGNGEVSTESVPYMGHDQSLVLSLPPLGALVLAPASG